MTLFGFGICVGGVGVIILLIIANDFRRNRPIKKSTKVMLKIGGIMTLIGIVIGIISAIMSIIG